MLDHTLHTTYEQLAAIKKMVAEGTFGRNGLGAISSKLGSKSAFGKSGVCFNNSVSTGFGEGPSRGRECYA
jgi:hypothetical protein